VGVGGAKNAALLAAEILALADGELADRLQTFRIQQTDKVRAKDAAVQERFAGDV
jgi:5-(carboxyamino)imidazole ribonucleotide mutase